ncbi:MAG: hypothetical protein ACREMD_10510 [Gemmatimonadota bacterium]
MRITGYQRKTVIWLLGPPRERRPGRRGRPRRYGPEVVAPLVTLWEAADRPCSKRLMPFLPTLLEALERHGEIRVKGAVRRAAAGAPSHPHGPAPLHPAPPDQAWVEQRKRTAVRQLVGYDFYAAKEAYQILGQLYPHVSLFLNFFHRPQAHRQTTPRGPRTKRFDEPRTSFQRLLAADTLDTDTRHRLEQQFHDLNPLALRREIDQLLETPWKLAERLRS